MSKSRAGRKRGGKQRGFFYRKGRGWYALQDQRQIPLCYEDGQPIKDENAPREEVQQAYARFLLDRQKEAEVIGQTIILDVCMAYLEHVKAMGSDETHFHRADSLFDFCFGLPARYRDKTEGVAPKELTPKLKRQMKRDRIHDGYGRMLVHELTWGDIDAWIAAHEKWKGGVKTQIQAVKRALNFGTERELIEANPIKGYRVPKSQSRVTYITPEQEEACYQNCHKPLALAIRVCIRTGARFGSEFARLTAQHVHEQDGRMEWVFKAEEIKNRKRRIIRITDTDIIEIARRQMKQNPSGAIFRNTKGEPWIRPTLSRAFLRIKKRLAKKGIQLDADACMYSTRHTYAKRILQGYWNGKPTNIETLARLMGNTPQVCRDHYLQWSEIDNEPLWEAC
jgi:integrase